MNFHDAFVVADSEHGLRLDHYLFVTGRFASRVRAQALVRQGLVSCDGKVVCKSSYKVARGQTVAYRIPPQGPEQALIPHERMLPILYQDADIVVVNKPQGLCVHAGAGHAHGTLVECALGQGIALASIGLPLRPGIVHRLDKGTSGVMVLAKTDKAHIGLARQFVERRVEKAYLALVIGKPRVTTIENRLGRHPNHRQKFASLTRGNARPSNFSAHRAREGNKGGNSRAGERGKPALAQGDASPFKGKEAITHVRVLGSCAPFSLVLARPQTGRTHQIRVHLSEAGCPIVGDALYGGGRKRLLAYAKISGPAAGLLQTVEFPFLHAYHLSFAHPISGLPVEFTAPLPNYFLPFVDIEWLVSL